MRSVNQNNIKTFSVRKKLIESPFFPYIVESSFFPYIVKEWTKLSEEVRNRILVVSICFEMIAISFLVVTLIVLLFH